MCEIIHNSVCAEDFGLRSSVSFHARWETDKLFTQTIKFYKSHCLISKRTDV